MNKLSEIYGRKIYDENSIYIGISRDVLLDPGTGEIKYLLKEDPTSIIGKDEKEARKFIRDNFIPFEKVVALGDIIIVKNAP